MHHVAIMNKSWKLIPKIVSGEKSIESRWYKTKRVPWNRINAGNTVFFKNSGEPVVARAVVSEVLQFEIAGIDEVGGIIKKYGKRICLVNNDPASWGRLPKYCILVKLRDAGMLDKPFQISKKGFGSGAAWITIDDIGRIKLN